MSATRWTRGVVLWTVVLAGMAGFQLWRGAWVDGILFTVLVVMLVIDNVSGGRIRLLKRPVSAPRWVIIAITGALGGVLIVSPRHGWVDLVTMIAVGVTMLVLVWVPDPKRRRRSASATRNAAVSWSILGISLCLWEAIAFVLSQSSAEAIAEYPTISILLDPILEVPLGRVVFVCLWLLGGLVIFRVWSRP